jgi:hypothetical protein
LAAPAFSGGKRATSHAGLFCRWRDFKKVRFGSTRPNLPIASLMTLHIRDFRQSDTTGLPGLSGADLVIGPSPFAQTRILCGLQDVTASGAIWYIFEGGTGVVHADAVNKTSGWPSAVQELASEALLWLSFCGAALIEMRALPADAGLLSALSGIGFSTDDAHRAEPRSVDIIFDRHGRSALNLEVLTSALTTRRTEIEATNKTLL